MHELELTHARMSAALNDYFANGLSAESIEQWSQDGSARVRRNRQQFISLFPSLAPLLALRPNDPFSDEICRAVDGGDEIVRVIASEFDVSPSTVRHLRGVPWSIAMAGRQRDEMDLLGSLEFIPPESRPRDKEEWLTLWILIDSLGFSSLGPIGHVLSDLCCRGYDEAFQLAMDISGDELFRLGDLHDYFGFVQRWAETLLGELGHSRRVSQNSAAVFLSGYRFPALWHQCKAWHEAILDPTIASTVSQHEVHWPSLLPEPFHTDGLIVTSLCSANELRAEGQEMAHCVSTYTSRCLSGESHILSIRTSNGNRRSTVEIALTEAPSGMIIPVVVQHRGHGNGDPPSEAKDALAELFTSWGRLEMQTWLKRSLRRSQEFAATMVVIDQDHHALIPWDSCVRLMHRVLPNYRHSIATLSRIAREMGDGVSDGPLLGNPILDARLRRLA